MASSTGRARYEHQLSLAWRGVNGARDEALAMGQEGAGEDLLQLMLELQRLMEDSLLRTAAARRRAAKEAGVHPYKARETSR